ncbi:preprotein translocase subunit SecE [Helicobacter enhydrae]|uniref:Preprotein translocase subunit SecE n=1 Tax=Helicobacter enhydrae TaxID=222136 RepID=A0A1B1U5U9_9HELI|nr:preprotein translocase subunit SecE [Helicobacter enhydrae]ANV98072.1 preprotein translocase subunit SecE [Helicobacter enhydrae]
MIRKIRNYYQNAKIEWGKVICPTKQQVKVAFFAVMLVVAVVTIFLALADLILSASVSSIL